MVLLIEKRAISYSVAFMARSQANAHRDRRQATSGELQPRTSFVPSSTPTQSSDAVKKIFSTATQNSSQLSHSAQLPHTCPPTAPPSASPTSAKISLSTASSNHPSLPPISIPLTLAPSHLQHHSPTQPTRPDQRPPRRRRLSPIC